MNARVIFSGVATASVVLTVSRQPGNNFRVAASCETNSLARLTVTNNVPDTLYVPGSDAAVSGFPGHITPLLTVWRRLHVELDSMAAVGTNNTITGRVIRINGNSMAPTREVVVNQTLHDGSPHLNSTPKGNGRFENGRITIGTGGGATTTTNLLGNGVIGAGEYVAPRSNAVVTIPFTITKGAATTNGYIVAMTPGHPRSRFTVNVALPENTYNNGTLAVAGHVFNVHKNQIDVVEVKHSNVTLNFSGLHDDDDDTVLPRQGVLTVLEAALADAYIVVLNDGGGDLANNQTNAPFVVNQPGSKYEDEAAFQRQSVGANDFWVVYKLMSYQGPKTRDIDPNFSETAELGVTWGLLGAFSNAAVAPGARGSQVFVETIRDRLVAGAVAGLEERVLAHEVGHQLGLDHWDQAVPGVPPGPAPTNLMMKSLSAMTNADARFVPMHLHLLRSRVKTPGP